jgi:hypothetical protein
MDITLQITYIIQSFPILTLVGAGASLLFSFCKAAALSLALWSQTRQT